MVEAKETDFSPGSQTDPNRTLDVAIVGYGPQVEYLHARLLSHTPGMRVKAIASQDPKLQAKAQRDFPSAAILPLADSIWEEPDKYDLVVLCPAVHVRSILVKKVLEAGLPVVVEPPMALDLAEIDELVQLSLNKQLLLTVPHIRLWDGDFLTVREINETGLLGPITRFESRMERAKPVNDFALWRDASNDQQAIAALFSLVGDLIYQAQAVFGNPTVVSAELDSRAPGAYADDDLIVSLTFAEGVRAQLWSSAIVRTPGPRFRLSGIYGTFEKWGLDPQKEALINGFAPSDREWGVEPRSLWGRVSTDLGGLHFEGLLETVAGRYGQFYPDVRDALNTQERVPVDPIDAYYVHLTLQAVARSIRSGKPVEL